MWAQNDRFFGVYHYWDCGLDCVYSRACTRSKYLRDDANGCSSRDKLMFEWNGAQINLWLKCLNYWEMFASRTRVARENCHSDGCRRRNCVLTVLCMWSIWTERPSECDRCVIAGYDHCFKRGFCTKSNICNSILRLGRRKTLTRILVCWILWPQQCFQYLFMYGTMDPTNANYIFPRISFNSEHYERYSVF